ncbi:MAG: glycosyltransferase family 2 protein [Staphylococcus equorum]|uniref:glycosyltransferase family 2 protein n=1 Tax=Acinetobacter guillouiae TaxID=106649 RepID=UPI0026534138|nr:glycosyltransferase family 2 protein [Staphylococcus equorum]
MFDKAQPLVSVVIPCYNHEKFIQHCINSIIDQSYQNIELIIIDDGSKDKSVQIIQGMVDVCKTRFVRFEFRVRPNKGLSATLNEGIEWSDSAYWTICSSDDYCHNNKILEQVNYLNINKEIDFCLTKAIVIDDNDETLDDATLNYNKGLIKHILFDDIFTFKITLPVTGMYRTSLIKNELKSFDESLTAEDYDINLRTINKTEIGIVNEDLYFYRSPLAIGQQRRRPTMRLDVSESHLKTINKYKDHELYKDAVKNWNYRRFVAFSSYYQTKKYAFKGMLGALHKLNDIYFYRAIIKLIFIWKDYNAK